MANTYTQIYVHIVFAVQGRRRLIPRRRMEELYRYITGILHNRGQQVLAIGGMPDHVHLFVGMTPTTSLSELVRDVKANSSKLVNTKRWVPGRFSWQNGYGAFSYARSQVDDVCAYILNQEVHHRRRSFHDEYEDMLRQFDVDFDRRYIFDSTDE